MIDLEFEQDNELFQNQDLTGERLIGIVFTDCQFKNCSFDRCLMRNCKFIDCTFVQCNITNVTIESTSMTDCVFSQCHLLGINWSYLLGGRYLMPIRKLENCQLKYNHFVEMRFNKFDFPPTASPPLSLLTVICQKAAFRAVPCRIQNFSAVI